MLGSQLPIIKSTDHIEFFGSARIVRFVQSKMNPSIISFGIGQTLICQLYISNIESTVHIRLIKITHIPFLKIRTQNCMIQTILSENPFGTHRRNVYIFRIEPKVFTVSFEKISLVSIGQLTISNKRRFFNG